ncbi:hypothetical protein SOVF_021230, partial [Spinacia oleracea]
QEFQIILLDKDSTDSHGLGLNPSYPPGFLRVNIGRTGEGQTDFCLQIDGAWKKKCQRAGMGWVLSSASGQGVCTSGDAAVGMAMSASHAEALACLHGTTGWNGLSPYR